MARWSELDRHDGPWIDVFVLMWEAYQAGTIPVGAVITDESGRIVARGRNRIFGTPDSHEIGGSRLANAEVNPLLPLSSDNGDVAHFYAERHPELAAAAAELPAPDEPATLPGVYATVAAARR